jgi:hypothetical protein
VLRAGGDRIRRLQAVPAERVHRRQGQARRVLRLPAGNGREPANRHVRQAAAGHYREEGHRLQAGFAPRRERPLRERMHRRQDLRRWRLPLSGRHQGECAGHLRQAVNGRHREERHGLQAGIPAQRRRRLRAEGPIARNRFRQPRRRKGQSTRRRPDAGNFRRRLAGVRGWRWRRDDHACRRRPCARDRRRGTWHLPTKVIVSRVLVAALLAAVRLAGTIRMPLRTGFIRNSATRHRSGRSRATPASSGTRSVAVPPTSSATTARLIFSETMTA